MRGNALPPNVTDLRLRFQVRHAIGRVCNLGCEANPAGFGTYVYPDAVNVDIDRWSTIPNFVQADGAALPFADKAFDTVVLGDVLEHCADAPAVLREAARVSSFRIVITLPTDDTPEAVGREIHHVEVLKSLGLVEVGPGDISQRHAHTGEHGWTEAKLRALVDPVFGTDWTYAILDTGARLPASPAIGLVAQRV